MSVKIFRFFMSERPRKTSKSQQLILIYTTVNINFWTKFPLNNRQPSKALNFSRQLECQSYHPTETFLKYCMFGFLVDKYINDGNGETNNDNIMRGLFLEGLIFGGAYLRKEICVSKSIGLAL